MSLVVPLHLPTNVFLAHGEKNLWKIFAFLLTRNLQIIVKILTFMTCCIFIETILKILLQKLEITKIIVTRKGKTILIWISAKSLQSLFYFNSCVDKSGEFDSQSSPAILEAYLREGCQRYLSAYTYQRPIIPRENNISEEVELTEHICSVNKTLAFVIIDSLYYFHFAEGLGIDILNFPDKTACVILDSQDESQFVMKEKFGRNNLAQFINDYVFGFLKRSMRSTNSKLISQKMNSSCSSENNKNRICISELTTETFLEEVLDPKKVFEIFKVLPFQNYFLPLYC